MYGVIVKLWCRMISIEGMGTMTVVSEYKSFIMNEEKYFLLCFLINLEKGRYVKI